MEDDLNLFENGRQPQYVDNVRQPQVFGNGRQPHFWKALPKIVFSHF